MSSRPVQIGLYAPSRNSYIGFERLEEDNIPVNHSSNSQTNRTSSSIIPFSNENSHLSVLVSYLSTVYNEIVEQWCQIKWLRSFDNHQETFLILNPDLTGYLTVQIAINEKCFRNSQFPLLNQPECLLIRTENDNKSFLLPNSIISLENLLNRKSKFTYGKLIAIICNEQNSQIMFYKALSSNDWYIFYNNQKNSSRLLTDEQQIQLEAILKQENQIQLSQLSFPLSSLCKHPIIFVYIVQKII